MFDLPRAGRGRRVPAARGAPDRDQLLQAAAKQREERAAARERAPTALAIQKWWRGRFGARADVSSLMSSWDGKLADLCVMRKVLAAAGVAFSPPLPVTMLMLRELLFVRGYKVGKSDNDRRLRVFCDEVLVLSLANADPPVNIATSLAPHAGNEAVERLRLRRLLSACIEYVAAHPESGLRRENAPLKTLMMLCGCRAHADLSGIGAGAPAVSAISDLCLQMSYAELDLFGSVRTVLLRGYSPDTSADLRSPPTVAEGSAAEDCWELALEALDRLGGKGQAAKGDGTPAASLVTPDFAGEVCGAFAAQVLSVPLVTARLPASAIAALVPQNAALFCRCLCDFVAKAPPLPPLPLGFGEPAPFVLGNAASLFYRLPEMALSRREYASLANAVTQLLSRADVPEAMLSERQAVTWRAGGGGCGGSGKGAQAMTAVAVPRAVQEQARMLLSEYLLKKVAAVLLQGVSERRLQLATPEERKSVREALAAAAPRELAAAAAREDAARANQWFGAKWAAKLAKAGMQLFGAENGGGGGGRGSGRSSGEGAPTMLVDSSAEARAAARGEVRGPQEKAFEQAEAAETQAAHSYDAVAVTAFAELVCTVLRRWGCGGGSGAANPVSHIVLNTLSFATPAVPRLWAFAAAEQPSFDRALAASPVLATEAKGSHAVVALFAAAFAHSLVVCSDADLYEGDGKPLPLHHLAKVVSMLSRLLFRARWTESANSSESDIKEPQRLRQSKAGAGGDASGSGGEFGVWYSAALERALRGLHDRNARRALVKPDAWALPEAESRQVLDAVKAHTPRARRLLKSMPFALGLPERLRVFEHWTRADRAVQQSQHAPRITFRVRRGRALEDGLAVMSRIGGSGSWRRRMCVLYVNDAGAEEAGIDMGGLFKDFWTDLSMLALDVRYGLFDVTADGLMYPSPRSRKLHGAEHLQLFELLGRVLGKALYEGITIQPRFATFFLGFMRGAYNFLSLFDDLAGLDEELFRNLCFLKSYDGGNVADLGLSFAVTEDDFGVQREVELVPGGADIAVTAANRLEYVNRVAKYYLVDRLKSQAEAFVRGLWDVIPPEWLQLFSEPELQVLISGSSDTWDVRDLQTHTRYSGGFVGIDPTVRRFWKVLNGFSPQEKAALLRFVTSCERAPPLGFASLEPPFTLHRATATADDARLPSASTCFNTLKLPVFSSEKVMRERLLTAIFSGAGFELS